MYKKNNKKEEMKVIGNGNGEKKYLYNQPTLIFFPTLSEFN